MWVAAALTTAPPGAVAARVVGPSRLLSERAKVFCPDLDVLDRLHSKWEFTRLVQDEAGFGSIVQAPESWRITGGADISSLPAPSDQLV